VFDPGGGFSPPPDPPVVGGGVSPPLVSVVDGGEGITDLAPAEPGGAPMDPVLGPETWVAFGPGGGLDPLSFVAGVALDAAPPRLPLPWTSLAFSLSFANESRIEAKVRPTEGLVAIELILFWYCTS
jgi:hypothetical protein